MKKKTIKAIKQSAVITVLLCAVFIGISALKYEKPSDLPQIIQPLITKEVQNYKPEVEKYAKEYDVSSYVDVILAMMMQESGGRGNDPMQSSESYCGEVGCIDDPALSIKQGVYYFSQTLEAANGDLELAVQSYNFGKGFINYVNDKVGKYTQEVAIEFSQKMYQAAPDKSIYTCLRDGAKKFDACYGDIYYVRDVLEYREAFSTK